MHACMPVRRPRWRVVPSVARGGTSGGGAGTLAAAAEGWTCWWRAAGPLAAVPGAQGKAGRSCAGGGRKGRGVSSCQQGGPNMRKALQGVSSGAQTLGNFCSSPPGL